MSPASPPRPWRRPDPLPEPVATTPRLVVRAYLPNDDRALFEAIDASREALLPWLPWARDGNRTVEICRDLIHEFTRRSNQVEADDFVFGVFDRETGALVGGTGYHRIDPIGACAEVGYWVHADRRREGLCREATAALITTGFRDWGFRRIKLCCSKENRGSVAVIDRLALRLEAVERAERFVDGAGWQDSLTYAVLADEWNAETETGPGGRSL
ncbi:MAG: GNAT family protein [Planctomycetota bacterium]|nr:GNAT family protein [Planctomycetota bacterium]